MSATIEAQQAHRARTEQIAMDKLTERLATQFPELPTEEITSRIHGQYHNFDHSPIRDFVPVLVERAVRSVLREVPSPSA